MYFYLFKNKFKGGLKEEDIYKDTDGLWVPKGDEVQHRVSRNHRKFIHSQT